MKFRGSQGSIIGCVFFLMVLFAALTSAVSLMETSVSTIEDQSGLGRRKSIAIMVGITMIIGSACALGFGVWDFVTPFKMSILDFLDFISNSVMMPIGALCTCFLVVKVIGFDRITKEIKGSSAFRREGMFRICIRYLTPICVGIILLSSIASALGWIKI